MFSVLAYQEIVNNLDKTLIDKAPSGQSVSPFHTKLGFRSHHFEPEPYACYPYTSHDYDRIAEIDYWLNGVVGFPMALGKTRWIEHPFIALNRSDLPRAATFLTTSLDYVEIIGRMFKPLE